MKEDIFRQGSEIMVQAAIDAGAQIFCGYPITPSTEILSGWAKCQTENPKLKFLQTEDETSAGFVVNGAVLAGIPAFTATAGPGNILMQDPIAMAEAMRLPFVAYVVQRGGPSTGTVIYSQQEVTLTCLGGNGEGLRIVYSPSSMEELYEYGVKAFEVAWKYRFPTFLLTDGYLAKMKTDFHFGENPKFIRQIGGQSSKSLLEEKTNLRNCYNFEEELAEELNKNIKDFEKISNQISEFEEYNTKKSNVVIFSHGAVAAAVKSAIKMLEQRGRKDVGWFRPITLRPLPVYAASEIASRAQKIIIIESSQGQFARLIRDAIYGLSKIETYFRPAMAITAEEIISIIDV